MKRMLSSMDSNNGPARDNKKDNLRLVTMIQKGVGILGLYQYGKLLAAPLDPLGAVARAGVQEDQVFDGKFAEIWTNTVTPPRGPSAHDRGPHDEGRGPLEEGW